MSKPKVIRGGGLALESFSSTLGTIQPQVVELKRRGVQGRSEAALSKAMNEAKEAGYSEGLQQGLADGQERGVVLGFEQSYSVAQKARQQELETFKAGLTEVFAQIEDAMARWYEQSEHQLSMLAIEIAQQVIKTHLKVEPETILSIVKAAIAEVTHSTHARIRINPADFPELQQHRQELLACSASIRGLEFVEDPALTAGAIIETEGGIIDASVEGQLRSLEDEYGSAA